MNSNTSVSTGKDVKEWHTIAGIEGITDAGHSGPIVDIIIGVGGERVLPFVPLAFGLGGSLSAVYNAGKAVDSYRYWNDYYRNTGYRPRYPFRAGVYDYLDYGGRLSNGLGRAYYYWR